MCARWSCGAGRHRLSMVDDRSSSTSNNRSDIDHTQPNIIDHRSFIFIIRASPVSDRHQRSTIIDGRSSPSIGCISIIDYHPMAKDCLSSSGIDHRRTFATIDRPITDHRRSTLGHLSYTIGTLPIIGDRQSATIYPRSLIIIIDHRQSMDDHRHRTIDHRAWITDQRMSPTLDQRSSLMYPLGW